MFIMTYNHDENMVLQKPLKSLSEFTNFWCYNNNFNTHI